jgi:hypothetical protein
MSTVRKGAIPDRCPCGKRTLLAAPKPQTREIKYQPMEPRPLTCIPFCKAFRRDFFSHGLRKIRLGNFLSQSG